MRVAFVDYVCDPARPGVTGLSDLVWDMASRLARRGDDVHVIAPYSVDRFPSDLVRVHRFPLPPIGYHNIVGHALIVGAAYRKLRSLARMDVVHVPEYVSAALLGTLLRETPVVFTEPGNIYERVARGNPYDPVTTLAFKLAARRAAATCARLIATSEEMATWWSWTGVSQDRICRVPLGIDTRLFRRVPDARARLGLAGDVPIILYAARLSRENGVDLALRAVARVRREYGPVQFHVLGEGPERRRLEALCRALGIERDVTWHGWVDLDLLPTFYSAADAFAFAGRSGGTPRVLLQAMACGAPVVASAIGGIVDHVEHGESGLLFPSGNAEDLAARLLDVLTDGGLATRLGRAAERYAKASVDWDVLAERIRSDVYVKVIGERRGAWRSGAARAADRRYGTLGSGEQADLSKAYDAVAERTALYPEFYSWVADRLVRAGIPRDATLLDVGCGTARMLGRLADAGYSRLAGIDFSDRCLALASQRIPSAWLWRHDILDGPVEPRDAILMSEVIEHLTDPWLALSNVRASLGDAGWLVLTFPNRLAFWPWYHLAPLAPLLPRNQRLRHWFGWFTMPYEMRSTQPLDHAYSVDEVREILRDSGFRVVSEHGFRLLPMLRISGIDWTERLVGTIERRLGRYLPRRMFYRYMFVCQKDTDV
ncbi:MAG: glycosyltransferase [Chloroflexota bacterium]